MPDFKMDTPLDEVDFVNAAAHYAELNPDQQEVRAAFNGDQSPAFYRGMAAGLNNAWALINHLLPLEDQNDEIAHSHSDADIGTVLAYLGTAEIYAAKLAHEKEQFKS